MDEFCRQAESLIPQHPEIDIKNQLKSIKSERDRFADFVTNMRKNSGKKLNQPSIANEQNRAWGLVVKELEALLKPFGVRLPANHASTKEQQT